MPVAAVRWLDGRPIESPRLDVSSGETHQVLRSLLEAAEVLSGFS
jgi:hypothetical protein